MMSSAPLILVIVLAGLIYSMETPPKHWDYLILSLRWPATLCNFTDCIVVPYPIDFVIHGLWPTREPDIEPEDCDPAPPFDVNLLEPILEELNKRWPNLLPGTSAHQFWHHEYHDHGRCALEDTVIPDQVAYFRVSLELQEKVNLLDLLELGGIKPNNDTVLQVKDVEQKLKDLLSVKVQLYCLKHHKKNPYLFEVRICFKPDLGLTDCIDHTGCLASPTNEQDTCSLGSRDKIGSLLGGTRIVTYSAMPCPPGPVIFPSS